MNQEELMEKVEFLIDQQRENGERTPEELLQILDKELANMKGKGLCK